MRTTVLIALLGAGCGGGKPTAEACAEICGQAGTAAAQGSGVELSAFESKLLAPQIEDIRAGVRPFDAQGFGICKGADKECKPEDFLGLDAGELPPGQYMIRAEALVPRAGELGTWTLKVDLECTTTRKVGDNETKSTSTRSKPYDTLRYSGTEKGYRLSPVYTIESPSTSGAQDCTYTITAPHPDGDKVWKGSYKVPDAAATPAPE